MDTDDLEVMLGKKIRGVAYEEINGTAYLMIITTGGRKFVFKSSDPIDMDLETEN